VLPQRPDSRTSHLSLVPETVTPAPFGCTVHAQDDVVTITPTGELDVGTVPLLEAAMSYHRDLGISTLVVDLRGLTFIDSSGVHLLLRWARDAARGRYELRVIPGSERVQLVFAMTGVLGALGLEARSRTG
jgi:anti-sigma B factor antagonist